MRRLSGVLIALLILSSSFIIPLNFIDLVVAQESENKGIKVTQTKVEHTITQGESASYYYLSDEAKKYVNGVYDSSEIEYLGFDKDTYDFGFTIDGQIVARATPVILVNLAGEWYFAIIRGNQITSASFYSIFNEDIYEIGYSGQGTFDLYQYSDFSYFTSSLATINKIALKYFVSLGSFNWIANISLSQTVDNTGALLAWRSLDNQALRYVQVNGTVYDLAQVSSIPPELMRLPASFLSDAQSLTSITWDSSILMDKGSGKISRIFDLPNGYGRALLAGSYNWGSDDSIFIEDALTVTEGVNTITVVWTGFDGILRDARFDVGSGAGRGTIGRFSLDYDDDSVFQGDERASGAGNEIPFTIRWDDAGLRGLSDFANIFNYFNETTGETGDNFFSLRTDMLVLIDGSNKTVSLIYQIMDGVTPIRVQVAVNFTHGSDFGDSETPFMRLRAAEATNDCDQSDALDFSWFNYTRVGVEFWEYGFYTHDGSMTNPPDFQCSVGTGRLLVRDGSPQNMVMDYPFYAIFGRDADDPVGLNPVTGAAGWYNFSRDFDETDLTVDGGVTEEYVDGASFQLDGKAEVDRITAVSWAINAFSFEHYSYLFLKTDEISLDASDVTVTGFTDPTSVEIHDYNDTSTIRKAIAFRFNVTAAAQTGEVRWILRTLGELPSVEDAVSNDTTTSTTYEDVDGLSVNITTAEQADILIMASIQGEANVSAVASWRLVFDGVNFQGLRRQVGTLAGNMVLVDLVENKTAGNYELKLQHNISAGLLSTINTTIYAVQLHNGNGRVPANSSFVESDTIAAAVPADISGLSTEITLARTSHVWMGLTWAGEFSLSPREGNFTVEISGQNLETRHRHWTSSDEWGALSLVTRTNEKLPNDTYTVTGVWQGDNTGTLTGMNFSLVVFAGEANGTVAEFDILKVVNPTDTTTATLFEDMDDLTLNFTTPDTTHVMGFLTFDSEVSNVNTDVFNTISINGTDQEEMKRGHASAAQSLGSEGQVVRTNDTLSAGVGNMTGRWHTDAGNTATGTSIILVAIVLFTEDTGIVELTIIFHTGISQVLVDSVSEANLTVIVVTLGDTVNISSTVSTDFTFYRYEILELGNHTHFAEYDQVMNQDLTVEAFTLSIGAAAAGVAGVSMLLLAIVGGFSIIVLLAILANRKR